MAHERVSQHPALHSKLPATSNRASALSQVSDHQSNRKRATQHRRHRIRSLRTSETVFAQPEFLQLDQLADLPRNTTWMPRTRKWYVKKRTNHVACRRITSGRPTHRQGNWCATEALSTAGGGHTRSESGLGFQITQTSRIHVPGHTHSRTHAQCQHPRHPATTTSTQKNRSGCEFSLTSELVLAQDQFRQLGKPAQLAWDAT